MRHVLDAIDNATDDAISADAMRWRPDPEAPKSPGRWMPPPYLITIRASRGVPLVTITAIGGPAVRRTLPRRGYRPAGMFVDEAWSTPRFEPNVTSSGSGNSWFGGEFVNLATRVTRPSSAPVASPRGDGSRVPRRVPVYGDDRPRWRSPYGPPRIRRQGSRWRL